MVDDSEVDVELSLDDIPNNVEEISGNIRNPIKAILTYVAVIVFVLY